MPSDEPNVDAPEGFDVGSIDDAIADESSTERIWVEDEDKGVAYWFDFREDVPLQKKNKILENNLTTERGPNGQPQQNLSSEYYTDMIEYMTVDWFGAHEDNDDVPSLRVFLNKMSSTFEKLQDEVPPPMEDIPDAERGN